MRISLFSFTSRWLLPVCGIVASIYSFEITDGDIPSLALVFLLVWVASLRIVAWRPPGVYRLSALYLLIFGLFHGGLLFSVALRGDRGLIVPEGGFIYGSGIAYVTRLCLFAMLGFAVTVRVIDAFTGSFRAEQTGTPPATLGSGGLLVQVVGAGLVFYNLAKFGLSNVLSGGYGAFVQSFEASTSLSYGLLLVGIGSTLGVMGAPASRKRAWWVFSIYALVMFPLGLRGEVLFPLAVMVAIEGMRPRRLPIVRMGIFSLVLLSAIGVVRSARVRGWGAIFSADWFRSPLDAIGEMGFSLRPASVVVDWHRAGEPYAHGITFVATFVRFYDKLVLPSGAPSPDFRLFNVEIQDRVGAIGGSPIAEGYHNFGPAGAVGLLCVIGAILAGAESLAYRHPNCRPVAAVVALPLFLAIRNAFAPVVIEWLFGLVVLALIHGIHRRVSPRLPVRKNRRKRLHTVAA